MAAGDADPGSAQADGQDDDAQQPHVGGRAILGRRSAIGDVRCELPELAERGARLGDLPAQRGQLVHGVDEHRAGRVQIVGRGRELVAERAELIRHRRQPIGEIAEVLGERIAIAGDRPLDRLDHVGELVGDVGGTIECGRQVRGHRIADVARRRRRQREEVARLTQGGRRVVDQPCHGVGEIRGRLGTEHPHVGPLPRHGQAVPVGRRHPLDEDECEHRCCDRQQRRPPEDAARDVDSIARVGPPFDVDRQVVGHRSSMAHRTPHSRPAVGPGAFA